MFSFSEIAPDGKPLKAALIGCGGRGTGAACQYLAAGPNLSIGALADVLPDKMEACRKNLKELANQEVPDEKCYLGFDAWQKVMEDPEIDLVLLCTPAHFRPQHFKAAIEAGKHVFMEKPCAVDPSGIKTVLAASKLATVKGLTVITGNQRRHQRDYWEGYRQVRNGMIGDVLYGEAHWNQGGCWDIKPNEKWSEMEYCIRNFFNIKWLSGDHFLDQGIHNIDCAAWFMDMRPELAVGYGGRARRKSGDIFDFFSVDYTMPNGRKMLATARQIDGCDNNVSEYIMGTKGRMYLNGMRIVDLDGNPVWQYDYNANPVRNAYEQEHIHLVESIRLNKKINQAEDLAYSNLIAIMGREAAYTGKAITWEEILASDLRYGPKEYAFGDVEEFEECKISIPGEDFKDQYNNKG